MFLLCKQSSAYKDKIVFPARNDTHKHNDVEWMSDMETLPRKANLRLHGAYEWVYARVCVCALLGTLKCNQRAVFPSLCRFFFSLALPASEQFVAILAMCRTQARNNHQQSKACNNHWIHVSVCVRICAWVCVDITWIDIWPWNKRSANHQNSCWNFCWIYYT